MAIITLTKCVETFIPVEPCDEVILCLTPEWSARTDSGVATACAKVDNLGRSNIAGPNNYFLTIDDTQFLPDPGNVPENYQPTCDDIVGIFPYKCIYQILLSQASSGGITADWVLDENSVVQTVDQNLQLFDVTFNVIDRISLSVQGTITLSLGQLFDDTFSAMSSDNVAGTLTFTPPAGSPTTFNIGDLMDAHMDGTTITRTGVGSTYEVNFPATVASTDANNLLTLGTDSELFLDCAAVATCIPSIPSVINDLTDVDTATSAPATNDLLSWDGTNWVPVAPTPTSLTVNAGTTATATDDAFGSQSLTDGDIIHFYSSDNSITTSVAPGSAVVNLTSNVVIPADINDLSDVDTSTVAPALTDYLTWDGTNWVPVARPTIPSSIDDLSDADTTTVAPTTGDSLIWDGTNWAPSLVSLTTLCDTDADTCFEVERTADDDILRAKALNIDVFTYSADSQELIMDLSQTPNNPQIVGVLRQEQNVLLPGGTDNPRIGVGPANALSPGGVTAPIHFSGNTLDRSSSRYAASGVLVGDNGAYQALLYNQTNAVPDVYSKVACYTSNATIACGNSASQETWVICQPTRIRIKDGAQSEGTSSMCFMASHEAGGHQRWRHAIGDENSRYVRGFRGAGLYQLFGTTTTAVTWDIQKSIATAYNNWLASTTPTGANGGTRFLISDTGASQKSVRTIKVDFSASFKLPGLATPTVNNVYRIYLFSSVDGGANAIIDGSIRYFALTPTNPVASVAINHFIGGTNFFSNYDLEVRIERLSGTEDCTMEGDEGAIVFVRQS